MKRNKILIGGLVMLVSVSFEGLSQKLDVITMGSTGEFLRPKGISGSKVQEIYADSAWSQTKVILENSEKPETVIARYELRSNQLEVKTNRGISVLDARIIKSFTAVDKSGKTHDFINGKEFTVDGVPMKGLLEVLSSGKKPLYKKHGYYIKQPDYNVAMAVGNPNEQLFAVNDLYYAVEKTLVKVPSKKKKLLEVFADKASQVEGFVDQNKLSVSKEMGVTSLFNYYNSL